jgi:hypothetical protein
MVLKTSLRAPALNGAEADLSQPNSLEILGILRTFAVNFGSHTNYGLLARLKRYSK